MSEELRKILSACRSVAVFTGAGISTESGIPDFRSPGGIWSTYRAIEFDEFVSSESARRTYWHRKFETHESIAQARPNLGHKAIAAWVDQGRIAGVITQNVDGLHQKSGVPDDLVVELHGNTTFAHCLDCGERHELEPIRSAFLADGSLPHCRICGGLVKPATISFGQAMPQQEMARAEAVVRACDLFLTIGTSLRVYPAAGFPEVAKRLGAKLVFINREATPLDGLADLVIHGEIGEVFAEGILWQS